MSELRLPQGPEALDGAGDVARELLDVRRDLAQPTIDAVDALAQTTHGFRLLLELVLEAQHRVLSISVGARRLRPRLLLLLVVLDAVPQVPHQLLHGLQALRDAVPRRAAHVGAQLRQLPLQLDLTERPVPPFNGLGVPRRPVGLEARPQIRGLLAGFARRGQPLARPLRRGLGPGFNLGHARELPPEQQGLVPLALGLLLGAPRGVVRDAAQVVRERLDLQFHAVEPLTLLGVGPL
mmetsp:Transcript_11884/g.35102  ORF Transcript_11884/g.35102 Transcript_11884/m.35102 type:complete len:237 (-) Transcript_11884:349-1059(-)